jgi:HD-GYP domain-containing protein (c-di-GMP phosphodiesterase class II)
MVKSHHLHGLSAAYSAGSAARRLVYCQDNEIARLLKGQNCDWIIAPLPEKFSDSPAVVVADDPKVFTDDLRDAIANDHARFIYLSQSAENLSDAPHILPVFSFLAGPVRVETLCRIIAAAFENLAISQRQARLESELKRAKSEIHQLNEIGIALSTERDRESLLDLILQKSREITNSDAGSLYLVEQDDQGGRRLRFKFTQNDSMNFSFRESVLPLDSSSVAGYIAMTGNEVRLTDVYEIPPSFPFDFNRKFDEETGYRTKSMLAVPAKDPRGDIIAVVQLINCKRNFDSRLGQQTVDEIVIPFPEECLVLLRSLASQAAVAIENIHLYENIETLFEGFVRASVSAIEARDPTTHGHSFRVADLTVGLAQAVDRDDSRYFRDIHFSRAEMKEVRYASLLHDFGKVGVREEILVKAKKLYPLQLDLVKERFAYVRKEMERRQSERKLAYLLEKGREEFLRRKPEYERELAEQLREVDEFLTFIVKCNEPTVLRDGNFKQLQEFAAREFVDSTGRRCSLLSDQELHLLSISRGNLDDRERRQIESHVTHTLNFLSRIPWTTEIKNIPTIAAAHHEKLDGTGYPNNLSAADIPIQSKMMTIADIYDALSAADRPYKKAVASELALDILLEEVKQGRVDGALLKLFRDAEIFRVSSNWKPS